MMLLAFIATSFHDNLIKLVYEGCQVIQVGITMRWLPWWSKAWDENLKSLVLLLAITLWPVIRALAQLVEGRVWGTGNSHVNG